MRNICLVQVVDSYGPNKFLPLSIGYQWLYACQDIRVKQGWQVIDVLIEKVDINKWVESIDVDLHAVVMSSYVWNWQFNNALARRIKQKWPQCVIVVGGPEVHKHDPDLIRKLPWLDVAVLGENEPVLQSLLLDLDIRRVTDMPGVVTKYTKSITQPSRTQSLDDIPSPILSGFYDDIMNAYQRRDIPVKYWQVTWETMRGCPYHCAFCDIGDEYWNKTMWFDLDRIYREIDWMGQNQIEFLSVCDSNWGIHPRDSDITKYIIDTKQKTGYPRIMDVTWAKNNPDRVRTIIEMDYEAKSNLLRGLNLSLQSLDTNTLKINERFNLRDNRLHETLLWYKENDIPTFTELIWPLPGETVQSLTQGLQSLIDLGQRDFLMIHPLMATNNSPLGQPEFREQQKITTVMVPVDTFWLSVPDPKTYIVEKEEAVISTATVSYEEYLDGNMIGHWLVVMYYYGWAHVIMQYLRSVNGIKEINFVNDLVNYFKDRPDTLIGREHRSTLDAYRRVFEHGGFWGRLLDQPYGGLYWEYKSGTCVVFHQHRQKLAEDLESFLKDVYDIVHPDLIRLNMDICADHPRNYPWKSSYDPGLIKTLFGINSGYVEFDHRDRSLCSIDTDPYHFAITIYHHRRKMRYWKCDVKSAAEM